jgi:L-gulono-1,4-lactone dehydrogenase
MHCKTETWTNWVGNQSCTAEVCHAASVDDLRAIVKRAAQDGKKIRVSGGGDTGSYSVSPIVTNESGIIVRVSQLNQGFVHNDGSGRVTAQAGMILKDLDELAESHGLGFETSPVPNCIEVGGAVALGCHGTGYRLGTFSDLIDSMEILTYDGNLVKISAREDPELMKAAKVNLGALGIMVNVTFQCVPRFKVSGSNETLEMKSTIANIRQVVETHDYVEVFWLPFGDKVSLKQGNRVPWETPDENAPGAWDEISQKINTAFQTFALKELSKFPRLTPTVMHIGMKLEHQGLITAPAPLFFHYQSDFPRGLLDLSYGFDPGADFQHFQNAWSFVCNTVNEYSKQGEFPQNSFMHARFIRNSDAYLAPSVGNAHTCMMQIITGSEAGAANQYLSDIENHLQSLGGRPHWGKTFNVDVDFGRLYGDHLRQFETVRSRMDPNGLFLNEFLTRVLAPAHGRTATS